MGANGERVVVYGGKANFPFKKKYFEQFFFFFGLINPGALGERLTHLVV
jgi:hypothetical protein